MCAASACRQRDDDDELLAGDGLAAMVIKIDERSEQNNQADRQNNQTDRQNNQTTRQ